MGQYLTIHFHKCVDFSTKVCALPIVVYVQFKYVTGSIRRLFSVIHIQADLKSDDSGVMLGAQEGNRLAC